MKPKPGDLVKRIGHAVSYNRINEIGIVLDIVTKDDGIVNPNDHCYIMWSSGDMFWHEIKWITTI